MPGTARVPTLGPGRQPLPDRRLLDLRPLMADLLDQRHDLALGVDRQARRPPIWKAPTRSRNGTGCSSGSLPSRIAVLTSADQASTAFHQATSAVLSAWYVLEAAHPCRP
jgi:hypothetical protein